MIFGQEHRYSSGARWRLGNALLAAAIVSAVGGCARTEVITKEQRAESISPEAAVLLEDDVETIETATPDSLPTVSPDNVAEFSALSETPQKVSEAK